MTKEKKESFILRINNLTVEHKPLFGQMNVNQMICHCTDAFRMAIGEKRAEEYGNVNTVEIIALARSGKTAPAPKGFDQVKGEGTKPVNFEEDKEVLKKYINRFAGLPDDFKFAEHPYFGFLNWQRWDNLMDSHLNHHLTQFGV
jgi:hypothetical protein